MSVPTIVSPTSNGTVINSRYVRLYNNPHFDYLTEMMPKDIKQLFQWCEIVYTSLPVIANAVRKLINYPITDFSYKSDSETIRTSTKKLAEDLKLKSLLLDFGNDYYTYGNVFRTIYMPFKRYLKCSYCKNEIAITHAEFKVQHKKLLLKCPTCGANRTAEIKDIYTHDIKDIRVVRWDPKQIELMNNPITGAVNYFYELPKIFRTAVNRADITVFKDTPKVFIEAAIANRNVAMGTNFYHAKTPGMAGFSTGWGIPPLMSTLKGYMYIAVLRRASEAIAMEHITPQRILFPQTAGSSDPCLMTSMDKWRKEIGNALQRWRMDPNYIMTAPYPTGVTNIGSQGRALIPTEEVKDMRMELAMALDIPPALMMGDTNIQNSAVSLRILENQLTPYVQQLTDFVSWLLGQINSHMSKNYGPIELVPFKLSDDLFNKQMLINAMGTAVSRTTFQELFSLDPDKEHKRMVEDQLADHDLQQEVQQKIQAKEENLAAQAQAASQDRPPQYDQQKMIAMAQEQAMQFLQVPYEQRRSMLAQLQNEDYVMWALVRAQLESMREQQGEEMPPQ